MVLSTPPVELESPLPLPSGSLFSPPFLSGFADSKHAKIKFDEELKAKYVKAFQDAKDGCPQRFF